LSQDFRGSGRPWGIFFGFYKTRHILLSDSASVSFTGLLRRYTNAVLLLLLLLLL